MHFVVDDQKDGLITKPNGEAISRSLLKLLDSPEDAIEMGKQGYNKVQQKYNWEKLASKLSDIYTNLSN